MKNLWIAIFVVLSTATLSAQDLDLGLKAGVNFADLTGADGTSTRTGFVFGGFAGVKFADKIGLQADLLYSQQGAEFDSEKIDLDYVNIPIVLKYYVTKSINLQAGPQFGFVVNDGLGDIGGEVKKKDFDTSGVAGLGLEFPFGIRASARYHFGLSKVLEVEDTNEDAKNSVITIAVGYSFL